MSEVEDSLDSGMTVVCLESGEVERYKDCRRSCHVVCRISKMDFVVISVYHAFSLDLLTLGLPRDKPAK